MESCSEKCPYDTHCDGMNCQRPDMRINNSPNTPEPAPVKNTHIMLYGTWYLLI